MTLTVRPLHPTVASEVTGVDIAAGVDAATVAELEAASNRYPVLVLSGQNIDKEQQVAFAGRFGPLEVAGRNLKEDQYRSRTHKHLADISNLDQDGKLLAADDRRRFAGLGDRLWHTDSSFKPVPAKYSMLYADHLPSDGHATEFADLRAAYDALSDETKDRIADLVAEHSIARSRSIIGFEYSDEERAFHPPVRQRVVRLHPGSRRMTLYLASHASHIVSWPIPEGRSLLLDLIDHATQPQFVYRHEWKAGDLVWWDDRCTMHRARPREHGNIRDMRRATIADVASTLEQPHRMAELAL
ncbi:MAG TPA: TauD/TfdA family dioxygenase [Stellaceae bacterium]|jgi:alpha-ketoglutarate-dependent 2,4-dichlorophenoxyacetate dioxygenase|nr:TauD/TfdA family dioxygenase [Stellaceae bacterium]